MNSRRRRSGAAAPDLDLAASAYAPVLATAEASDSAEIRLVRCLRSGGEQIMTRTVWSHAIEDQAEAEGRQAWLLSNAEHLTEWGRTAAILGPEALTKILEAKWNAELLRIEDERRKAEKEARDAETIWLTQDDVGPHERPAIVMRQGRHSEPFLTIKLREEWEQARIFDWARWQSHRYHDWKEHCVEHGQESLERLMMTEMLKTENAVKKAGLGSGSRRPLRFWRGDAE
jgi:hypothetical protein